MYTMTVAPGADVSGGFYSLKAAFAAMPEDPTVPVTIRVMPGIYHEKLSLTRPNITIEGAGASPSDTVISFGDYGYEIMPDGIKRGTFRSYTFFVHAADVTLRNLTIENTAGIRLCFPRLPLCRGGLSSARGLYRPSLAGLRTGCPHGLRDRRPHPPCRIS